MENFTPIILLILIAFFALINFIRERLGRRFEQPAPPEQPVPDMGQRRPAARHATPMDAIEAVPVRRSNQRIAPRRTARRGRSFIRGGRNMRRAIIAMTVLGPCRANEPPE